MSSKYAARMARLSARIFGEYYEPPLPKRFEKDPYFYDEDIKKWFKFHKTMRRTIFENSFFPHDIDLNRNYHGYYPPQPQIKALMETLREYGLYRDEHLDFKEEMLRLKALRGKRIYLKYDLKKAKSIARSRQ